MLDLTNEHILRFYENMLKTTQSNSSLPEYSEIFLRLAFKEVFGINYNILPEHLDLCRKLLVLHYFEKYPSISSVLCIMDRCFDRNGINVIIAERQYILCQWREFKKNSDTLKRKIIDVAQ